MGRTSKSDFPDFSILDLTFRLAGAASRRDDGLTFVGVKELLEDLEEEQLELLIKGIFNPGQVEAETRDGLNVPTHVPVTLMLPRRAGAPRNGFSAVNDCYSLEDFMDRVKNNSFERWNHIDVNRFKGDKASGQHDVVGSAASLQGHRTEVAPETERLGQQKSTGPLHPSSSGSATVPHGKGASLPSSSKPGLSLKRRKASPPAPTPPLPRPSGRVIPPWVSPATAAMIAALPPMSWELPEAAMQPQPIPKPQSEAKPLKRARPNPRAPTSSQPSETPVPSWLARKLEAADKSLWEKPSAQPQTQTTGPVQGFSLRRPKPPSTDPPSVVVRPLAQGQEQPELQTEAKTTPSIADVAEAAAEEEPDFWDT